MIRKSLLLEQLEKMPDKFTIDELIERLVFTGKIESGLKDSKTGNKISEQELENEMKKWFG